MPPGVFASLPDGLFVPHEPVRVLGSRPNPVYLVRQAAVGPNARPALLVAERFAGAGAGAGKGGAEDEGVVRDARRLATLASPNVARVREVTTRGDDLVVFGEFVEGEKLQELWRSDKLPLEIALRLVLDVLTGVAALHNLRDARQQPMKLAHGELSPATVLLGLDGLARVLHAAARRAPGVEAEKASLQYLAPEVASGERYDARADVFGAGVLLWEALSRKTLFAEADPAANARRVRGGPLPPATVPDKAPWAQGLVAVAAKALAAAPDDRWPGAAAMAAEVRKAAGLKLAPASTAAAFAKGAFGERVKARREALEKAADAASPSPRPVAVVAAAPSPRPAPVAPAAPSPRPALVPPAAPTPPPAPLVAASPAPVPSPPPIAAATSEAARARQPSLTDEAITARPPPGPPIPSEAPSVDVDLASVMESVAPPPNPVPVIAPPAAASPASVPPASARLSGSDVMELGSDSLLDAASEISAPVPESSAPGGFVVDPFTGSAGSRNPFGPRPAAAPDAPPPYAAPAALAPPAPLLAPGALPPPTSPAQMFASSPSLDGLEDAPFAQSPAARRRKLIVLGSVAGLGLLVFLLAGIRLATRTPDTGLTASRPADSAAAAPPPTSAAGAPPVAPTTLPAAPTTPAPPVAKVAAVAAPPAQATTAAAATSAKPHASPAARAPAASKPHPKPKFDPNSL